VVPATSNAAVEARSDRRVNLNAKGVSTVEFLPRLLQCTSRQRALCGKTIAIIHGLSRVFIGPIVNIFVITKASPSGGISYVSPVGPTGQIVRGEDQARGVI
jgi:hypothetical protein